MSFVHVHRAHYGGTDVKHAVEHLIRAHGASGTGTEVRFKVTNHTMGGDPVPGVVKHLTVVYSWGSPQEHVITMGENEVLIVQIGSTSPQPDVR